MSEIKKNTERAAKNKALAKELHTHLKPHGFPLSYAYESLSRLSGFRSWNHAKGKVLFPEIHEGIIQDSILICKQLAAKRGNNE